MALYHWKKLGDELVKANPFWEYRLAEFELKDGKRIKYNYVKKSPGVIVIGINNDGLVALIKEYRAIIDRESLQFPAGGKKADQSLDDAAHAEMAEETQFAAKHVELMGSFSVSHGMTDAMGNAFVAWDLTPQATEHDETEEFEVSWHSIEEIDRLIMDHTIFDGWSIAAWQLAKPRVMEIISSFQT